MTNQIKTLFTASTAAWAKAHRNAGKMHFIGGEAQALSSPYSRQLDQYRTDAEVASAKFAAACVGLSGAEIAAIIG